MDDHDTRKKYWVAAWVDDYDPEYNTAIMRCAFWEESKEELQKVVAEANEPLLIVYPEPFTREPFRGEKFSVKEGVSKELDKLVVQAREKAVEELYRERKQRGPKL